MRVVQYLLAENSGPRYSPGMLKKQLLLFDTDGTLLESGCGAHLAQAMPFAEKYYAEAVAAREAQEAKEKEDRLLAGKKRSPKLKALTKPKTSGRFHICLSF
jgi:hypothetical protein